MADHKKTIEEKKDNTSWGDEIITMHDVLKQEEEHEAEIQAVLGGSDAKSCTYAKVSF